RRTTLLLNGMTDAVEVESRHFRCGDHSTDGDVLSIAGEFVATARAPGAAYNRSAPKAKQNLLDVIDGKSLAGCNVAAGNRPLGDTSREVKRADDAVLG